MINWVEIIIQIILLILKGNTKANAWTSVQYGAYEVHIDESDIWRHGGF